MKRTSLTALALAISLSVNANRPDSVYVKPDVNDGTRDFQIAYSLDQKHWTHVGVNLFESDYGPWGSEKKLYYPVLDYDGKTFRATFIPNPKIAQVAVTESADFALWKPQDYPKVAEGDFQQRLEQQRVASKENVIRVPYSAIQALTNKKQRAEANAVMERENFVQSGSRIASDASNITATVNVHANDSKKISPNLMGIFFEDISYAADGGLYAELIQNRDFEYSAKDRNEWNAMTAWTVEGNGTTVSIETANPLHQNNQHYALMTTTATGGSLVNEGWDGIVLHKGERYNLTMFLKGKGDVRISLIESDEVIATTTLHATNDWKPITKQLTAKGDAVKGRLVIEPLQAGQLAVDYVSLFPKNTFNGRSNGLRADLAQTIADMHPRFVRFPGGCASHGQGIDNIYHWQATIGDPWTRQHDSNIWHYHQTRGLGFYEYFLFCEDLGAEPLPVLAAGVPCQNSSRGGNGQQGGLPFEKDLNGQPSPYTYNGKPLTMESYLQELLDLIEWANGDAKTSPLAAMRAKAGHPKPFNLKYLGIGNEDLISDTFMERYTYLIEGVRKAHPEITIVGTVGPFWEGSDYEYGWDAARAYQIPIVDEHYYNTPGWYFNHRDFYDKYSRTGTKVYLGEWASKGNNVSNALVEAAYLTNVERNADVVTMTSYAPLLAKEGHTSWNPDLIYFNNITVHPTANYYVQCVFGQNSGDEYVYSDMTVDYESSDQRKPLLGDISKRLDCSVVKDSNTGDVIMKLVNMNPKPVTTKVILSDEQTRYDGNGVATLTILSCSGQPDRAKEWTTNEQREINISKEFALEVPQYSLVVVRTHRNATLRDKLKNK